MPSTAVDQTTTTAVKPCKMKPVKYEVKETDVCLRIILCAGVSLHYDDTAAKNRLLVTASDDSRSDHLHFAPRC